MTRRTTTHELDVPFGPDDFRTVVGLVTGDEWDDHIFKRWRHSYYEDRRKALGDFATGKITGEQFLKQLPADRHKELGGRRGPVTVSSNAKLTKLAARALFVRELLKNPAAPEEAARRYVIGKLATWVSDKTVYRYLREEPIAPADDSHP